MVKIKCKIKNSKCKISERLRVDLNYKKQSVSNEQTAFAYMDL